MELKTKKTYLKIRIEALHTYTNQKKRSTNLKSKTKLREAPRSKKARTPKPKEG
jgi:hypothetical protein